MGYACADDEILVGFELSNEGIVDKIKCCSVGGHSSVTDVCSIDKSESDKASCDANKHMVFNGIYDKQDPDAQEDAFVEVLAGKCCEVQCHAKWCGANDWGVSDECKKMHLLKFWQENAAKFNVMQNGAERTTGELAMNARTLNLVETKGPRILSVLLAT